MFRDNSAGFLQGFSVCQPFFGAALQFYPALGTKQLDDLINSYIPGSSSIRQKRATVSMEFFEFAQLTGNTFKFYPVLTHSSYSATASSAEASPPLGSAANSSLVSPVIFDWTSSQPSSSNLSVSNPSSTSHEPVSLEPFKEGCSGPAKGQVNDFSHIPGMKIMTKDGIDVTNSASRGCKTKAQRDHAHLMRIIKACDSCKKKKVRCDPSHKKRTVSQARAASSSARPAKKARTLVPDLQFAGQPGSKDVEAAIEPSAVIREDMFVELAEPWGTPSLFTNESASISPIDYDFFIDPEGKEAWTTCFASNLQQNPRPLHPLWGRHANSSRNTV
ncbi:hypothetical protein C8035_v011444 [Colletotrichum spinosum]|uniref:Zn(2)-C6 fungal-type domain-containing protein n=1 Tax=Colletotrichum spinosum TaxID=1347390 RepID=A0A4R8PWK5_9PEZI|nr:hypothetical protein C8035_v011444 [Colletotrichum spinosum]